MRKPIHATHCSHVVCCPVYPSREVWLKGMSVLLGVAWLGVRASPPALGCRFQVCPPAEVESVESASGKNWKMFFRRRFLAGVVSAGAVVKAVELLGRSLCEQVWSSGCVTAGC